MSSRLRRRLMVTCGWVRDSVCIALMGFTRFPGNRPQVRICLHVLFTAWLLRVMGRSGLAPIKVLRHGRTES